MKTVKDVIDSIFNIDNEKPKKGTCIYTTEYRRAKHILRTWTLNYAKFCVEIGQLLYSDFSNIFGKFAMCVKVTLVDPILVYFKFFISENVNKTLREEMYCAMETIFLWTCKNLMTSITFT